MATRRDLGIWEFQEQGVWGLGDRAYRMRGDFADEVEEDIAIIFETIQSKIHLRIGR